MVTLFSFIPLFIAGLYAHTAQIETPEGDFSKQGKIVYDIQMNLTQGAMMEGMGQEMTMELIYFKKKSRVRMNMQILDLKIITHGSKTPLMLLDIMGQKMAIWMEGNEKDGESSKEAPAFPMQPQQPKSFTEMPGTKKIAGYTCKKLVTEMEDGSQQEIWYTDEIRPKYDMSFLKLTGGRGIPMEFEGGTEEGKMKMTARSVSTEIDKSKLKRKIPEGYKEADKETLKQFSP